MAVSSMSHLECSRCKKCYDPDVISQLCSCGGPLLVKYDMEYLAQTKKSALSSRSPSLWRYLEFLPVRKEENIVTLGEGMTPIVQLRSIGRHLGTSHLYMKDEGIIPTGTFKCRGAAVGVSRAKELGVQSLAMPSNGNAGAAWALYAARAGIKACIVMPEDAPSITMKECVISGANLYLVKGLIGQAGNIVGRAINKHGWYDASTLKEPYRIEGKKTMGLEIAEQFNWKMPDVIIYPTGGGVGIIGIYKGLLELKEIGWIEGRIPRMVVVQSHGCAPIVRAWEQGRAESEPWQNASTVAFGINVPKALGDFLVLEAVYKTAGCAVAVSDGEILKAQIELAVKDGVFVCPEGAATLAAAKQLYHQGWMNPDDEVVLLNTGAGIKYPETVELELPVLEPNEELPE
jgi:threonine synthase